MRLPHGFDSLVRIFFFVRRTVLDRGLQDREGVSTKLSPTPEHVSSTSSSICLASLKSSVVRTVSSSNQVVAKI
ncbi:hypothetical protein HUJ05_008751 [Dendroctonus ponderosae]|nr:hypothetical protein HUJ05_008751 [Dendroctonus ponderosae]